MTADPERGEAFGRGPLPLFARHRPGRLAALDIARGIALLAMFVYHFAFDLALFGFVDWQVASAPGWRGFAIAIASSFILLSGVSLTLAHGNGIRWRAFWTREAVLVAAAALVTLATSFAMPGAPIYFGILHAIALFSLLGLAFLFVPVWLTLAAAAVVFAVPFVYRSPGFDGLAFVWLGLSETPRPMMDHEPLFPWFAATLIGIAVGRLVPFGRLGAGWYDLPRARAGRAVAFMGRNSLVTYLVHQPVFFAILLPIVWLTAPPAPDVAPQVATFRAECTRVCGERREDPAPCPRICGCMVETMTASGLFREMTGAREADPAIEDRLATISEACVREAAGGAADEAR